MQPKVYTIATHRPFLPTLAAGLLGMAGTDPMLLPRITVLLPTRRAMRSLRDAFLHVALPGKAQGAPLLLPRMRPIGDLDFDELSRNGVIGLPEYSEPEKGRMFLDAAVVAVVNFIRDFAKWDYQERGPENAG